VDLVETDYYARYLGTTMWACSRRWRSNAADVDDRSGGRARREKAPRRRGDVSVLFPGADAAVRRAARGADRHRIRPRLTPRSAASSIARAYVMLYRDCRSENPRSANRRQTRICAPVQLLARLPVR